MIEFIKEPWPWYIAGPLIGLVVPALLVLGNKAFGISSSLKHICAACIPANIPFFKYDWRKESWNLFFVIGIAIGGLISIIYMSSGAPVNLNPNTIATLEKSGLTDFSGLLPSDVFSFHELLTLRGFVFIILGGFLFGFGTRYADGCTSGHAIMGISTLQWSSVIATCCFMVGGIITSWFILPLLLQL